jgi:hypothetical protein
MLLFILLNVQFSVSLSTALSPACIQRGGGLAKAGVSLLFGRAQMLIIPTNFRASHTPACAKPLVVGSACLLPLVSILHTIRLFRHKYQILLGLHYYSTNRYF